MGQIGAILRSPQEFQREMAGAVLGGSADGPSLNPQECENRS